MSIFCLLLFILLLRVLVKCIQSNKGKMLQFLVALLACFYLSGGGNPVRFDAYTHTLSQLFALKSFISHPNDHDAIMQTLGEH